MNRAIALGLGAALAVLVAPAAAQNTAAAGIRYDCDTPADRFSDLLLPAGPAPFLVTGKVRLARTAQSDRFAPLTRIAIASATAPNDGWAGFEYAVIPDTPQSQVRGAQLAFSLRPPGGDVAAQLIGPPSAPEVAFSLLYDGAEAVVTVDGKELRMPFASDAAAVKIVCSTGEFVYTDLRVWTPD